MKKISLSVLINAYCIAWCFTEHLELHSIRESMARHLQAIFLCNNTKLAVGTFPLSKLPGLERELGTLEIASD